MADRFLGDVVGGALEMLGLTGDGGLLAPGSVTMETDPFSIFLAQHYLDLMPMFFRGGQSSQQTMAPPTGGFRKDLSLTASPTSSTDTVSRGVGFGGWDFPDIEFPDLPDLPPDMEPTTPTDETPPDESLHSFQTAPTYDPNSLFGQAMAGSLSGQAIDPASLGMLGRQDVEDYFQSTMYDPAMQNYQNRILPQLREGATNLHSSYRQNLEAGTLGQLHSDLMSQRGDLQYQNLLNNQRTLQSTAGQNLNAQTQAMGMSTAYDPRLQWLNLIGGQTPSSVAVQNPSTMDQISQMAGIGALISMI